jgi:hypothetical protein
MQSRLKIDAILTAIALTVTLGLLMALEQTAFLSSSVDSTNHAHNHDGFNHVADSMKTALVNWSSHKFQ